jgi:lipopolysaccharide/colanic/teichoic acid biosynthesis glycosyltransferase
MSAVAESDSTQLAVDASFPVCPSRLPDRYLIDRPPGSARVFYEPMKRLLDVLIALLVIILAAIPIGIAAVLIKLSSPGPVFYGQTRCGREGTSFRCWKLRTMVCGADEYFADRPELRQAFEQTWKLGVDPRITRVGAFLRKTSLDETPQLWNVLRGEMSMVGPRPVVPNELCAMYGDQASTLLSIKPGLTGLWQVCGRSRLSYGERVRLDLLYVRSRSPLLDLRILSRTPFVVLAGQGAV